MADEIVNQEPSPRERLEEVLKNHQDQLSPRERDILLMRLGLFDDRPYTLEEVAMIFGVTRERIRMLENKAFRILRRDRMRKRLRIRDFYAQEGNNA